nr:hypothetical protein [Ruminococcus sp.]
MKKILAVLIAATFIFSLASCGSSGSGSKNEPVKTEPTDPPTIASEKSIANISFKTPDNYESVGRYIIKSADGKITEKDISFYFDDDSSITYACNIGIKLADVLPLSSLKKEKYNGMNYYIYESKPDKAALIQRGKDVYGFRYSFAKDIDNKAFKKKMNELSFTNSTSVGADIDDDLYAINYSFDKSWKLIGSENNLYENPKGEITKKDISWSFGKDKENPDFRFMIKVVKNAKVKDELPD